MGLGQIYGDHHHQRKRAFRVGLEEGAISDSLISLTKQIGRPDIFPFKLTQGRGRGRLPGGWGSRGCGVGGGR
ncbi:MAG: hypothetical protein V9G20_16580 [Candidatus Promineifilaceae bacterium]|nr:hypothetical protein [Chloroflexota bacterium]